MGGVLPCKCNHNGEKQSDTEMIFDCQEEEYVNEEEEVDEEDEYENAGPYEKKIFGNLSDGHRRHMSSDIQIEIFDDNVPELNSLIINNDYSLCHFATGNTLGSIVKSKMKVTTTIPNNQISKVGKIDRSESKVSGANKDSDKSIVSDYKSHCEFSYMKTDSQHEKEYLQLNIFPTQINDKHETLPLLTDTSQPPYKPIKTVETISTTNHKTIPFSSFGDKNTKHLLSILKDKKILNCVEEDILFHSDLFKVISLVPCTKSLPRSAPRFCVLTKRNFMYYKSKEQFITLQKPIGVVALCQIIEVSLMKLNQKSKRFDHLSIRTANDTKAASAKEARIPKKSEIPSFVKSVSVSVSVASPYLYFTSEKEDVLKKWMIIFNYLIDK